METNILIKFILMLFAGYLIGSFPSAYLFGKWTKGIDIRQHGSGNVGFTNVYRVAGALPGILTLIIDVAKGFIPTWLGFYLFGSYSIFIVILGMAAIAGHNWSCFLKGSGGKGVATSTGVFLGILPIPLLFAVIIFVITVLLTRYISLGSIIGSISLTVIAYLKGEPIEFIVFSFIATILIIFKHQANIKRLLSNTENKFYFSKSKNE